MSAIQVRSEETDDAFKRENTTRAMNFKRAMEKNQKEVSRWKDCCREWEGGSSEGVVAHLCR